jgi:hypothetical protein
MAGIETRAFLVQVSRSVEFAADSSILFVLPTSASSCALNVGRGVWFFRVGACVGTEDQGKIEWSQISGPVEIGGVSDAVPPPPWASAAAERLQVLHVKSIDSGARFHTGRYDGYIALFEVGPEDDIGATFPIGKTKWKWTRDRGIGWVDCWSLEYPRTYSIRISSFDSPTFPTSGVKLASIVKVFPRCVPARTVFHRNFEERLNEKGDAALLRQRRVEPNMKFASHADYLRYQAAIVRSSDVKSQTVGPAHFPKEVMK